MKKVMVWNFKTEKYEQATAREGKEILGVIESMNADCARQSDICPACDGVGKMKILGITLHCSTCHGTGKRR